MRRMRTIAGRFLSALICAALALGPIVALSASAAPLAMTGNQELSPSAPCGMPCDGCADGKSSLDCVLACNGLIAAIPALDAGFDQKTPVQRAVTGRRSLLTGHEPEPDTPPPKIFLV